MALISCPECEKEISDKVGTICPNCGYKVEFKDADMNGTQSNDNSKAREYFGMFIAIAFIVFIVGVVNEWWG